MLSRQISTQRLLLRRFSVEDVQDVYEYANDREWQRFLPVPSPYTLEDAEKFVASTLLRDWSEGPKFAVCLDAKVVGETNIRFSAGHRIGEVGYSIARSLWGRGLVTEATRGVIAESFRVYPQLVRVRAAADAANVGSLRVMEKLGMTHEGTLRSNMFYKGQLSDAAMYAVLRDEWEANA